MQHPLRRQFKRDIFTASEMIAPNEAVFGEKRREAYNVTFFAVGNPPTVEVWIEL